MIKLAIFAALLSMLCRWALGKWPWDYLRAPPARSQAVFSARKLLGVEARATHAEIREAHRRLAAMLHPDKGGTNGELAEINAARDLLLNELPDEGQESR